MKDNINFMGLSVEELIELNHYDVLAAFNDDYYRDLVTKDHLGEETVIKAGESQKFIYPVKYRGKLYALPSELIENNKLPIKITKATKLAYRNNVYHLVKGFDSFIIKKELNMTFKQFIDTIAAFPHSKYDTDFLLYKIAIVMLYIKKGFMRCVSEAAFGKNSVPGILKILLADIAIFNPRTAPAFEAKLINKFVILDELTNLERSQRDLMQEALLQIADGKPSYEKGSRGSTKYGTKDEYDISKLSIAILYNVFSYYQDAGQGDKYFDFVFTKAVKDRFLPVYFDGTIDGVKIPDIKKPKKLALKYKDNIIKLIRFVKYLQANIENMDKDFKLFKTYRLNKSGRQDKTFNMILQGFRMYATDEKEYNEMADRFYQSHKKYSTMIASEFELVEGTPKDEPKINKDSKQSTLM